ncbi:MAG: hypothetical protein K5669_10790 [Lachnospiraceae bacterium]|nr:hypothetical protein [Lachnospiraceae bacterium]
MNNIYNSILGFVSDNHYLAILLLCIVFSAIVAFIPVRSENRSLVSLKAGFKEHSYFIIYCGIFSVLLLIPVTAFIFRQFQTVFYPYEYLWALVPVVPMISFVLVSMSTFLKELKKSVAIVVCVFVSAILFVCGSMGTYTKADRDFPDLKGYDTTYEEVIPVLDRLNELNGSSQDDFIILASPAVTEYAHFYSGDLKTLYGRDMWDGGLAPYNYTVYSDTVKDLYKWMLYEDSYGAVYLKEYGDVSTFNYTDWNYDALDASDNPFGGITFVNKAAELGVKVIVFTVNEKTDLTAISHIEEVLGISGEFIEVKSAYDKGYIIFCL